MPASRTLELRACLPGPDSAGCSTSRRPSPFSSLAGSDSPMGSAWRSSRCTSARRSCPGLTAADLEERSFYELLRDRYGIVVVGGEQTIEPTVTDEDESEALGVPLHSPAFRFERVTHSRHVRSSSSSSRSTAATDTVS